MPARAFIDSDLTIVLTVNVILDESKCPRGHLLILILIRQHNGYLLMLSKCPRGHLLILIRCTPAVSIETAHWSKCPRGHLLILILLFRFVLQNTAGRSKCPRGHLLILI